MLKGKLAYICSPLNSRMPEIVEQNMMLARFYMYQIHKLYLCRTMAPHAYLPMLLNDSIPKERNLALKIGMEMLDICNLLIICGRHISDGMKCEIQKAFESGMEVYWYDSIMKPSNIMRLKSWKDITDEMQV